MAEARFIKEAGTAAEVAALAEPVLESLGFRLVLVRLMGGQAPILEIMAERPDGSMSIEDCKTVSMGLSPVLDVHDPLPNAYRLQISSPGIDRPLVRASDFDRWAGHEAKIETKELISGRRRFRGIIEGFEEGEIRLEIDLGKDGMQVIGLPLDLVGDARLVLTDALIRQSLRDSRERLAALDNDPAGDAESDDAPAPETPAGHGKAARGNKNEKSKKKHKSKP
ncbi:MAG: ribosome maturation factor RimP [Hyphomicrobiaceae bacterium]